MSVDVFRIQSNCFSGSVRCTIVTDQKIGNGEGGQSSVAFWIDLVGPLKSFYGFLVLSLFQIGRSEHEP